MIRQSTIEDIPAIVDMASEFFIENEYSKIYGNLNKKHVSTLMDTIVNQGGSFVCEDDNELVGVVCGMSFPAFFNNDIKCVVELIWWMKKEYRQRGDAVKLMVAFENWAKEIGAQSISMISLENMNPERVGSIYERLGFVLKEHTYLKVI